jgi:hypothetical protein
MANLTIVVDDQLLQAARIKALKLGTSVNEVCREAIARFAQPDEDAQRRARQLRSLADRALPSVQRAWPGRERLYDEVLRERGLQEAPVAAEPKRRATR